MIKLSVFSYENEDSEAILNALLDFFPFSPGDNNVAVDKKAAEGFNERKIEIFEIALKKSTPITKFLKNLLEKLGEGQIDEIKQYIEPRLDKNLDFFLRFDKDAWLNGRKLLLTDSGKCFHVKIGIAAFPKKREIALNVLNKLLTTEQG